MNKATYFLILTFLLVFLITVQTDAQTRRVKTRQPTEEEIQKQKAQQDALANLSGGSLDTESEIGAASGFHGLVRGGLKGFQITAENAKKAGLNVLNSPRLLLVTDLPIDDDLKQWGNYLDQATQQFAAYFKVPSYQVASWKIRACVMKNNVPFMMNDLLPDGLPPFDYGFQYGNNVWLYAQESRDYQRHLFLHECTHAFMNQILKGCGSLWFGEGLAEYFGTHRIENGRLTMGVMPRSRNEFPHWGRIRFIQNDLQNDVFVPLNAFFSTELKSQDNRSYAWAWALVWMMNSNPSQKAILQRLAVVDQGKTYSQRAQNVNRMFREAFTDDQWREFSMQWEAFISDLEYGMDPELCHIENAPSVTPLNKLSSQIIRTDKDWQNVGVSLEKGKKYQIKAMGEYNVCAGDKTWPCEPNGITIRYFRQKPLGALLAAIVAPNDGEVDRLEGFNKPIVVGNSVQFTAPQSGALWFKINRLPNVHPADGSVIKIFIEELP
ncbi:MAG: hypothetical protein IJQ39_01555 [Thermoguttaceae bacterium]|nr:hypothetical protein [Thermoguttaceae bacterium]